MLTKDVENVGKAGDVKEVTDGYGRNYLLPRKLAVVAHKGVDVEAKWLCEAVVKRETKDWVDDGLTEPLGFNINALVRHHRQLARQEVEKHRCQSQTAP